MNQEQLLDAALNYARGGWRIFPCHGQTKRPLLRTEKLPDGSERGWKEQASADLGMVRAWWKQWPRALIGCPMGGNVGAFVVDLDPEGHDPATGELWTIDLVRARLEEVVGVLPQTRAVQTPRPGLHLWFAVPDGVELPGNARGALPAKRALPVDVRGEGGYVILPPSVRADGKAYQWIGGFDSPLAICPPALLDRIMRRGAFDEAPSAPPPAAGSISQRAAARPPGASVAGTIAAGDDAVRRYSDKALRDEAEAVAGAGRGERNTQLNNSALKLGLLVGAGALDERAVRQALEEAAARAGIVKEDGVRSVRATIASGLVAGKRDPRDIVERLAEVRRNAAARAAAQANRPARGRQAPRSDRPSPGGREGSAEPARDQENAAPDPAGAPQPLSIEDSLPTTLAMDGPALALSVDKETFDACCALDQSDTDNGKRLRHYLGHDLLVRADDEMTAGSWLVWTGTHWDLAGGAAGASRLAQKVGDLIVLEADYLPLWKSEQEAIAAGEAARAELKTLAAKGDDLTPEEEARAVELEDAVKAMKRAREACSRRKSARKKFGVSSKNKARIAAMLDLAAPHLRRPPDAFNADQLLVATRTHTLRFVREMDDECPDPSVARVKEARVEALEFHRRSDLITALVPFDYDPAATCPRWRANLAKFQPDETQRRTVQAYAGLGLLGLPIQRIMYHWGSGGNFKSVFLETLTRVLGDAFAVGLPATAISGFSAPSSGSGATPELARLYGKRMLRILELPAGQHLKTDLIKKLTGGERFPVRSLFKGFWEFTPQCKPHMSGNDEPPFDGSDGGMKRRMLLVEWPVSLPESEQRDFEEVVRELVAEGSGILNWLIEGALDYLQHGLVVAGHIRETTQSYIDENDPVGQFDRAHVETVPPVDGQEPPSVTAREMYNAYRAWCEANGKRPMSETRFGRTMKKKRPRDDTGRVHLYRGVRLHDVPEIQHPQAPFAGGFAPEEAVPP